MAQGFDKSELIAQLAAARSGIAMNALSLRQDLDVKRRLEAAIRRHQLAWLAGASLVGFALIQTLTRRKKVAPKPWGRKQASEEKVMKAGLLVTALKLAFDLLRPALTKYATRLVTDYAQNRFAGASGPKA